MLAWLSGSHAAAHADGAPPTPPAAPEVQKRRLRASAIAADSHADCESKSGFLKKRNRYGVWQARWSNNDVAYRDCLP